MRNESGIGFGINFETNLIHGVNASIYTKNLETDQIKHVDDFLEGIEIMKQDVLRPSNPDPRKDEDLIVIAVLKELTIRYFSPPSDSLNNVGAILKSKINPHDFIAQLATIRFKDKNTDMILIMLKQLSDILLEVLLNPNSTTPQLNLMKSAKSSINVLLFLVKGYFQQIKTIKSIYCEDSSTADFSGILSAECQKMVRPLVSVTVELFLPDQLKPHPVQPLASAFQYLSVPKALAADPNMAGPQPILGQNSGFNLNPNYMAELDQPMFNGSMDHSADFLGRNIYLQRSSAQLKRQSFEFPNPNSLRSEHQFGAAEMEGALKESGPNLNKFVASLVGKKGHE